MFKFMMTFARCFMKVKPMGVRPRLRYYLGLSHLFRECPHLKPYLITFVSCCTKANLPTGGGRFPNAGLDSTMASS
jgi:hypothetical protein